MNVIVVKPSRQLSPPCTALPGEIRHIRIGHESADGWFLRKVLVERKDLKREWHFPCYRWLDTDKDDLCPYRTLTPSHPDSFRVGEAQMAAGAQPYQAGAYDSTRCLDPATGKLSAPDAALYAEFEAEAALATDHVRGPALRSLQPVAGGRGAALHRCSSSRGADRWPFALRF